MTEYRIGMGHIKSGCTECGDCWEWRGIASPAGVPKINVWVGRGKSGRTVLSTRRVVWEMTKGAIPAGKLITPKCGNPRCLNPDHLSLTDHGKVAAKNGARIEVKMKRLAACGAIRSHNAKLDAAQVAEIRASDKSLKELAGIYGVGRSAIDRARNGQTYRDVRNPFLGLML